MVVCEQRRRRHRAFRGAPREERGARAASRGARVSEDRRHVARGELCQDALCACGPGSEPRRAVRRPAGPIATARRLNAVKAFWPDRYRAAGAVAGASAGAARPRGRPRGRLARGSRAGRRRPTPCTWRAARCAAARELALPSRPPRVVVERVLVVAVERLVVVVVVVERRAAVKLGPEAGRRACCAATRAAGERGVHLALGGRRLRASVLSGTGGAARRIHS